MVCRPRTRLEIPQLSAPVLSDEQVIGYCTAAAQLLEDLCHHREWRTERLETLDRLLELAPKLDVIDGASDPTGPLAEVREALAGLGYAPDEIRSTLADMPADLPVEEMLRRSLKDLGKARG